MSSRIIPSDDSNNIPSLRTLGGGAQEAAAGNDSRLSDQRTPLPNSVDSSKIQDGSVTIGDLAFDPATQAELDAEYQARVAADQLLLVKAANLADLASAAAARGNLGLGLLAVKDTALLGDIAQSGALDQQVVKWDNAAGAFIARLLTETNMAASIKDGTVGTPSLRTIGTGPLQAAAGNDARLSDARTPTGHHVTHEPGGSDAMAVDAAVGVASLRSLGVGTQQAAQGSLVDLILRKAFYPETYGAVGDLSADDKTALQSAMNACAAAGGTLILKGKYRYDSQLIIPAGLDLRFASPNAELVKNYAAGGGTTLAGLVSQMNLIAKTGSITNGSPIMTGIGSTVGLAAGMTVSGLGILSDTTILSVDSSSQVTFNQNALQTNGAAALNFITKANGIRITGPGKFRCTDLTKTGGIIAVFGDDFVTADFTIDTWAQGRAVYGVGDRWRGTNITMRNSDGLISSGGWRYVGGNDSIFVGLHIESGDDALQMVPSGATSDPLFDKTIRRCWYIGCTGRSIGARFIAIAQVSLANAFGQMTSSIIDSGCIACRGYGNVRGLVIMNRDSTGDIDGVTIEDCAFDMSLSNVFTATGSITNGSAVVTGIDTTLLSETMSLAGTGIPGGTTILSIDSPFQLTMSANATATNAAVFVTFGSGGQSVLVQKTVGATPDVGRVRRLHFRRVLVTNPVGTNAAWSFGASVAITCSITSGSAAITVPDSTKLRVGMLVANAGLVTGASITSIDSPTQVTISAVATATNAAALVGFSKLIEDVTIADCTITGGPSAAAAVLNVAGISTCRVRGGTIDCAGLAIDGIAAGGGTTQTHDLDVDGTRIIGVANGRFGVSFGATVGGRMRAVRVEELSGQTTSKAWKVTVVSSGVVIQANNFTKISNTSKFLDLATDTIVRGDNIGDPTNYGDNPSQSKAANVTLVNGSQKVVNTDTTSGGFTVTLPATPSIGSIFQIIDQTGQWNTNALTVNPNGKTIDGVAGNVILTTQNGSFSFLYDGIGWRSTLRVVTDTTRAPQIDYLTARWYTAPGPKSTTAWTSGTVNKVMAIRVPSFLWGKTLTQWGIDQTIAPVTAGGKATAVTLRFALVAGSLVTPGQPGTAIVVGSEGTIDALTGAPTGGLVSGAVSVVIPTNAWFVFVVQPTGGDGTLTTYPTYDTLTSTQDGLGGSGATPPVGVTSGYQEAAQTTTATMVGATLPTITNPTSGGPRIFGKVT